MPMYRNQNNTDKKVIRMKRKHMAKNVRVKPYLIQNLNVVLDRTDFSFPLFSYFKMIRMLDNNSGTVICHTMRILHLGINESEYTAPSPDTNTYCFAFSLVHTSL